MQPLHFSAWKVKGCFYSPETELSAHLLHSLCCPQKRTSHIIKNHANKEEITVELELRVAQIDAEFKAMIDSVSADTIDGVDEARMQQLLIEKNKLMEKLNQIAMSKEQDKKAGERMNTIFPVIDGLKNHPITYDDEIVRQLIDCVVVESKEQIKIVFRGGLQLKQTIKSDGLNFIQSL